MNDYAAFAAEYDGGGASAFDEEHAADERVLGDPPALDDASWSAMLETAYTAPEGSGDMDLLAEFAASITGIVDGFGEAMAELFDAGVDAEPAAHEGDAHDVDAHGLDLDGDGVPDGIHGDAPAAEIEPSAWEAGDAAPEPADGVAGDDLVEF